MEKAKVKEVWEKPPGTLGPLLIDFEHADVCMGAYSDRDLSSYFQTKVYSNTRSSSYLSSFVESPTTCRSKLNTKQVVILGNEKMAYIGSTDNDLNKSTSTDGMKTFLALKKGNKVRIVEVTPMTVSPHVRDHTYKAEATSDAKPKLSQDERREAETQLVKAFGSKKKRLAYENKEKNKVVDMNDTIRMASSQAKLKEVPETLEDTSYLAYIPPCNRNASVVDEVYLVSDLLYDHELEQLETPAREYLQATEAQIAEWRQQETFSGFFFEILKYLKVGRGDKTSILSMKLVLYAEILIRIFKLRYNELRKRNIDFPSVFPPDVAKRVLDDFTFVNALHVRTRPEELKDKACCHIMVAVLLASDYKIDLSLMSTIFQMHIKRLSVLAKAVGITLNGHKQRTEEGTIGTLSLPLAKPVAHRPQKLGR